MHFILYCFNLKNVLVTDPFHWNFTRIGKPDWVIIIDDQKLQYLLEFKIDKWGSSCSNVHCHATAFRLLECSNQCINHRCTVSLELKKKRWKPLFKSRKIMWTKSFTLLFPFLLLIFHNSHLDPYPIYDALIQCYCPLFYCTYLCSSLTTFTPFSDIYIFSLLKISILY